MASIYIHIPYCERKCLYCDFYSIEGLSSKDRFLAALGEEIDLYSVCYGEAEPIETIFFGGGTPSLLAPSAIKKILDLICSLFNVEPDAEITIEANPGTITQASLSGYLAAGVNRISIGIQSLQQMELQFLQRIHSAQEAESAVKDAYAVGFKNVSIDLIFSIPGQTRSRWEDTLQRSLDLRPTHISAYSLIVEEGTPLYSMVKRGIVTQVSEKVDAAMYESTMSILARNGYRHYEISNYALPGFECRHNLNYWNHANYLSFGPSAHSFWRTSLRSGRRWWNDRNIDYYCSAIETGVVLPGGEETVNNEQLIDEAIMLGLRCGRLDLSRLATVYGYEFPAKKQGLMDSYIRQGYLTRDADIIGLTSRGFMVCDVLIENIIGQ